jgi:hypothetical protein
VYGESILYMYRVFQRDFMSALTFVLFNIDFISQYKNSAFHVFLLDTFLTVQKKNQNNRFVNSKY